MTKQKSIVDSFTLEPYNLLIHICIGDIDECNLKLGKKYKKIKNPVLIKNTSGQSIRVLDDCDNIIELIIHVNKINRNNNYSMDTIAHECYHAVDNINYYISNEPKKLSNEHEAYLMGYLVRKCLETADKLKRKNKQKLKKIKN